MCALWCSETYYILLVSSLHSFLICFFHLSRSMQTLPGSPLCYLLWQKRYSDPALVEYIERPVVCCFHVVLLPVLWWIILILRKLLIRPRSPADNLHVFFHVFHIFTPPITHPNPRAITSLPTFPCQPMFEPEEYANHAAPHTTKLLMGDDSVTGFIYWDGLAILASVRGY